MKNTEKNRKCIRLISVLFYIIFFTSNCHAVPEINLYYPKEVTSTYSKGEVVLTGEISLWKKPKEGDYYWNFIQEFDVQIIDHRDKASEIISYKVYGFKGDPTSKYELTVSKPSNKKKNYALFIRIYGFEEKPGRLIFSKKVDITNIGSGILLPLKAENFNIGGINPNTIKYDTETIDQNKGWIAPKIWLEFNKSSVQAPSDVFPEQTGKGKVSEKSEKVKTDTSEKSPNSPAVVLPINADVLGNRLWLEFIDKNNTVIANDVWGKPFVVKQIPEDIGEYTYIRLITPFGICQCNKPSNNTLGSWTKIIIQNNHFFCHPTDPFQYS